MLSKAKHSRGLTERITAATRGCAQGERPSVVSLSSLAQHSWGERTGSPSRQHKYAEAATEFRVAIEINSDDAEAHYNLGLTLGALGETDQALAEFRHAVRLKPSYAEAHYSLALALQKNGNAGAAEEEFYRAKGLTRDHTPTKEGACVYLEKFSLKDRIAVITGAGRGIGLEVARAFAEAGAGVIIAEIIEENGRAAARSLTEAGYRAEFQPLDVADSGAVNRFADAMVAKYGRIPILVNNAGMAASFKTVDYPDEEYRRLMRVNLGGTWFCSRAFGRHMLAAGSGSIVNVGSMSGLIVNKPQPQAAYNASKGAILMLTKSLACEWAKSGVRVNAVAPGYIATELARAGLATPEWSGCWLEMTPMGRCGEPSEVASAVLFLASDAASYITGAVLCIDGGYTAW